MKTISRLQSTMIFGKIQKSIPLIWQFRTVLVKIVLSALSFENGAENSSLMDDPLKTLWQQFNIVMNGSQKKPLRFLSRFNDLRFKSFTHAIYMVKIIYYKYYSK